MIPNFNRNLFSTDDQMEQAGSDLFVNTIFTRNSHHESASVVLTSQNYFNKNMSKNIVRNCLYKVFFQDPAGDPVLKLVAKQFK